MKKIYLILFLLCTAPALKAQDTRDFSREISEHKFSPVKIKKLPIEIINALGCDSREKIGTRKTQAGCTSGKRWVVNWVVTDNNGIYVMSLSTCGAYSTTGCAFVFENKKYEPRKKTDHSSFEAFKKTYLEKN